MSVLLVLDLSELLALVRVGLSVAFMVYASWSDFKTREVSNTVWIVFAPIAFLLTFAQFLFFPPAHEFFFWPSGDARIGGMVNFAISFAVTSVFSIALFYSGAFGGADAKALMCLALAVPQPPTLFEPLSGFTSYIFPVTVFSNAVIVAALSVFYAVFRNLWWRKKTGKKLFAAHEDESFWRRALALLCGYRVSVEELKRSFLYPLEDAQMTPEGEVERHLLLFPKDESREEIVERIVEANSEGKIQDTVWATPGLPMLIFITVGLLLAFTIGDIVWIIISQVLG